MFKLNKKPRHKFDPCLISCKLDSNLFSHWNRLLLEGLRFYYNTVFELSQRIFMGLLSKRHFPISRLTFSSGGFYHKSPTHNRVGQLIYTDHDWKFSFTREKYIPFTPICIAPVHDRGCFDGSKIEAFFICKEKFRIMIGIAIDYRKANCGALHSLN